ncbi:MAG: SUF system Fe-S cluster assembly regulator [Proteobacteria bacterium]|nr:SUF system Fe-S cluster assembly regulator [Pseudomonadota bacterium]
MIKLGKLTDYAIVVMGQLFKEGTNVLRSAHFLAEKTSIPEPTVAKVLKLLAQAGLVESLRGAAGGYRLAKPPALITVADIITAIEGPITIVSCVEGSGEDCKLQATCLAKSSWAPVNNAIRRALETVKLTDMVGASGTRTYAFIRDMPVIQMEKR